jgi:hypothetical protein
MPRTPQLSPGRLFSSTPPPSIRTPCPSKDSGRCDDGAQLQRLLLAPKRNRTEGHRRDAGRKPSKPIDELSRSEHISVEFARRGLDPCGRIDGVAQKHDLTTQVTHLAHDDGPDM